MCFIFLSINAAIQFPNALNEREIVFASSNLSPVTWDFLIRSKPAKSTKKSVLLTKVLSLMKNSYELSIHFT